MRVRRKSKTKLTKEQFKKLKGSVESFRYVWDKEQKVYVLSMRVIKGLALAKDKAQKFALATHVGKVDAHLFLTTEDTLSPRREDARVFYAGFDDPLTQARQYGEKLKIKLYQVTLDNNANRKHNIKESSIHK